MKPSISVREATLEDAEMLARLMAEMDDPSKGQIPFIDSDRMRCVLKSMAAQRFFRVYLVLENALPVASFSLMIFSSPAHQGMPQALLDAVVVTRMRRGAGIGEAMVKYALELARAAGCYKMMLSSNLKRVAAHRFYENIGFEQHGISFALPIAENSHAISCI
ncbi:MAG: GNAT family N-acetyltransferase [Burkholderiales bacterium]|nr:GNAT family N-acetyltransferase [Burkholderiales bacterium]